MLGKWARALWLAGILSGLCAPAPAITTSANAPGPTLERTQTDLSIPAVTAGDPTPLPNETRTAPKRLALLLPLRSENFGAAAQAVRDGFLAGYERDRGDMM